MADTRVVAELIVQGAQKFVQDYLSAQQAVQTLTTTLQQSERIRTPQLAPQIAAINSALQQTRQSASQYIQSLQNIQGVTQQVTKVSNEKTGAIDKQSQAEGRAKSSGISYLSTLSAIHAASFLATNRTFSLIGSFTTLGLAFSKLGPGAIGLGLAFGGLLGIFGAISNAAAQLQQALLATAQGLVTVVGVVGAAVTAASAAGVKIAADAEQSLAGLRAFGGATTEQLRAASAQAGELALRFGVSARDVLEAASLFSRAGGEVQDAINGATEAIIQLTVASAGEIQAAQAAIAVSQGIKAFKLEASDAIRVTNVLTGAAQASALSFTGVTQAFIQAAPGARTLGISIEDLGAAMALLGNELVKGTITGTAFKQFILDLINPSDKAKEQFAKFKISVEDSTGAIRPFGDIVKDLNTALGDQAVSTGKVTAAERARALAIIFESRASLAANIITREGVEGLDRFRDKLEEVTASNIVNVLLLPLNKQLEILQVTVQEVGRAFGGSLLAPIRAVTVQAIDLFKQLIPAAQLAGQAVASIATGQGFEALQTKITDLVGNNQLSSFLIELVNMFRNVSDVIQNAIIPAIVDFANRIGLVASEAGRVDQIGETFNAVNRTIQTVGRTIAVLIGQLAELAVQIVHNEGVGGQLRDTLGALVSKVLAGFLATVIALVPALAAAAAAMPIFARASILVAQIAVRLIDVFKQLELKFIDIAELAARVGFITAVKEGDTPEDVKRITDQYARLGEAAQEMRKKTADALDVSGLSAQLDAYGGQVAGLEQVISDFAQGTTRESQAALAAAEANAAALRLTADEAIQAFDFMGTEASHAQAEAAVEASTAADAALERAKINARGFVGVFDQAGGKISDALANIIAEVDKALSQSDRGPRGTTGAPPPGVDPGVIEATVKRVQELARDLGRRLQNLNEDTTTRVNNILDKGLERVGDIFEKASEQLHKLSEDAQDQINEIFENITQRRDDRRRLDDVKEQLDEETRLEQRRIDEVERLDERALEQRRLLRQRDTEDNSRQLDEQLSDLERVLQRSQDASERGLREIQRVREDALKTTQDLEEKQLSRSLDAQATARREQQQLGEAKTPEDRAKLQKQFAQTRADTQFSIGQQNQLDALKKKHETQNRELQKSNEAQNLALRSSQEAQLLQLRKNNEKSLLLVRRNIEDGERQTRQREDDAQLLVRQGREEKFRVFREGQERTLRNFTDELENEAATRQAGKIITRALERAQEITANATRQALELETSINQQLDEQRQQLDRALRALDQTLTDFEENLTPDVRAAVSAPLAAIRAALGAEKKVIDDAFETNRAQTLSQIGTAIGVGQIDLTALQPNLTIPTTPVQVVPHQVIQASVIQAAQLIIGQAAAQQLGHAFLSSLRQAGQEGTFDNPINLNPVVGAIQIGNQLLEQSRRMFGR